jgi:hypothetical protein
VRVKPRFETLAPRSLDQGRGSSWPGGRRRGRSALPNKYGKKCLTGLDYQLHRRPRGLGCVKEPP